MKPATRQSMCENSHSFFVAGGCNQCWLVSAKYVLLGHDVEFIVI